jgi:hypothetical protein
MPATSLDLIIEQGATFSQAVALGASTWDGQATTAQVRQTYDGNLLVAFTAAIAAGTLTLSLTAVQTATLVAPPYARPDEQNILIGYYDAESVNAGVITRHRMGKVYLSRGITS